MLSKALFVKNKLQNLHNVHFLLVKQKQLVSLQ